MTSPRGWLSRRSAAVELPDHPGRIADGERVVRNVLDNDGARADDASVAYRDARADGDVASVKDDAAEVDEDLLFSVDEVSVIAVEREALP